MLETCLKGFHSKDKGPLTKPAPRNLQPRRPFCAWLYDRAHLHIGSIVSQFVNGPVWKGESARFSEGQLETHRNALRWQTDQQLREAYERYRGALALDADGWPPPAARVQYFVTAWRELRRRRAKITPASLHA